MRVSWLIPVRNGGHLLQPAVRSALEECEAGDEVLVVDDGSSDGAVEALEKDSRLRCLHQPPKGIVAALEYGRKQALGELIARLDSDDVSLPGRIQRQKQLLASNPRTAAVGGRARIHRDGGEVSTGMQRYVDWLNGLQDLHSQRLIESPLFHPAATFRASAVEEVGGYRHGDFPEDYDLWLRLVAGGWNLENIPQDVVSIRDHDARLTRTDSRYSQAAFRRAKQSHLQDTLLSRPRNLAVWGAGRTARPWIRWLIENGHTLSAVIDIGPGVSRQGVPIHPPSALPGLEFELLFVAVGIPQARQEIREQLRRVRPDLVEGKNWWAVA